jgi:hypothetical protein
MATVTKDFKVKNGLIVEGTTGTINNHDILTKKQDDQNYIVNLIGGTATSNNEANKVVKRDANGNFAAGTITADLVGDVTGNADTATTLETSRTIELTGDVTGSVSFNGSQNVQISTTLNGSFATDAEVATAKSEAIDTAEDYTNTREAAITAAYEAYADQSELDAIAAAALDATSKANAAEASANSYTDDEISALDLSLKAYADQAETDAIASAALDATTKANAAKADAKSYTDARETAITTAYEAYADQVEVDAKAYTDARETAITTAYQGYASNAALTAEQTAKSYADQKVADLVDSAPALLDTLNEIAAAIGDDSNFATTITNGLALKADITYVNNEISDLDVTAQGYADAAEVDAKAYTDARETAITTAYRAYADAAEADAIATASADATSKANAAESDANSYTDGKISQEVADRNTAISSAITTEIADRNTAINAAVAQEVSDRNSAISVAIANLDSSSQDDLAAAIAQEVIDRNSAITVAVDALDTDDIEEGVSNLYHTSARAKTAAAELLTGATLTNIQITGNGSGLTITAENGVADSDTDDLDEGTSNLYFTNARAVSALEAVTPDFPAVEIATVAKQVAASASVPTASTNTAVSWASADYRSAEFLVKIANGTHTEVSKVILTLDTSDNVAITEYAMVGTNGSLGSVSADVSGSDVRLRVTTSNNSSTVAVVGTLLK